jgi:hypothetical protein
MRLVPWAYRRIVIMLAILAAAVLPAATAATTATAATAGTAATGAGPVHGDAVAAAAAVPAALVTNARPGTRSKRGLAAPVLTAVMQSANATRQAAARSLLQLMARKTSPHGKCPNAACRAGLPRARDLAATQQPQARGYFCGPAMVSEMLAQLGVKIGQFAVARELDTTANGTNWSDSSGYPVPRVLNENQMRSRYVAVALPWTPTARQIATYETDLVVDINHKGGVPLAGNAYEVAGGPHLVGNPVDQTIMHWIDIRGYQNYGAITDYEDSVHGATSIGWSLTVPAYSAIASSTMADILGARGYDW